MSERKVLTDEELWCIRNNVAINEVTRDDGSREVCIKHGRAVEAAVLSRIVQPAPAQGDEVTDDQLYDAAVEAWTTQTDSEWSTDGLRAAINAVREALSAQREQPKCDHEYVAAEKIGDDYVAECRKCGWAPARALLGQREG